MTSVSDLLAVARSQLGVAESPAYSNDTPYTRWAGMVGQPWCDLFVSWCFEQAGMRPSEGLHAYTPTHAGQFRSRGRWADGMRGAQPGDVVFFDFPGAPYRISHVGFVEAVQADGSLITIEGNTNGAGSRDGGRVMRHVRRSSIVGYGRPDYTGTESLSEEAELMGALEEIREEFVNQDTRLVAVFAKMLDDRADDETSAEWKTRVILADLISHLPGFDQIDRTQLRSETQEFLIKHLPD